MSSTETGLDTVAEFAAQLRVDSIRRAPPPGPATRPPACQPPTDGGAGGAAPALRLGRPGLPGQRPPDLFQGARVPAAVLDLQGGRGGLRRGADDRLPAFRAAPGRPPYPGAAVGGRGHRLARTGPAGRGRRRAGRQIPRRAAVPGLGALRGQRDGRGIDMGGARQGLLLRADQPDRDHRRQPARPARRDRTGLGHRGVRPRAEAFGAGPLAIDGHDLGRDRPGAGHRGQTPPGPAHGDLGQDPSRAAGFSEVEDQRRLARQAVPAPNGGAGPQRARRRAPPGRPRPAARSRCPGPAPPTPPSSAAAQLRAGDKVATRQGLRRGPWPRRRPRPTSSALDGEVSNSTYATSSRRPTPTGTSRCSSPSSSWLPPRSGSAVRGYTPFASTFAAFFTRAYDFIRMAAISQATCGCPAPTPASRSARTARRRWRWRTWR